MDKIHDTEWMRTAGKEIVRMEISDKKLRFVIPIERSTLGRLPKLIHAIYKVLLDAGVRNMIHQFFERGMDLHDDHSKHAVVSSTTLLHMICSLDPPGFDCEMIFALHAKVGL